MREATWESRVSPGGPRDGAELLQVSMVRWACFCAWNDLQRCTEEEAGESPAVYFSLIRVRHPVHLAGGRRDRGSACVHDSTAADFDHLSRLPWWPLIGHVSFFKWNAWSFHQERFCFKEQNHTNLHTKILNSGQLFLGFMADFIFSFFVRFIALLFCNDYLWLVRVDKSMFFWQGDVYNLITSTSQPQTHANKCRSYSASFMPEITSLGLF